ncbi:hypothetical protein GWI33_013156, partial [Rhynchophorus ferrugineus]
LTCRELTTETASGLGAVAVDDDAVSPAENVAKSIVVFGRSVASVNSDKRRWEINRDWYTADFDNGLCKPGTGNALFL